MNVSNVIGLVAAAGAVGGLGHGLVAGEFAFPRIDTKRRVFKPGVIGDVAVGILAAVVVWTVYGAAATFDLNQSAPIDLPLPVAQLGISIIVGISGAKILTKLAERTAERVAKNDLAKLLEKFQQADQR